MYSSIFDIYDKEKIDLYLIDEQKTIQVDQNTHAYNVLPRDPRIVAFYSNNEILSLNEKLDISSSIKPMYCDDLHALPMLQDTICLITHMASTLAYPGLTLKHRYNIGKALYFQYNEMACSKQDIKNIQKLMNDIVDAKIPIHREVVSFKDAIIQFKKFSQNQTVELLQTLNKSVIDVASVKYGDHDYIAMWLQPFLANTDAIAGTYKLVPFHQGFLVYYGQFEEPEVCPLRDSSKLQEEIAAIMDLHLHQANTIGFNSAASLNQLSASPKVLQEIIAFAEFNHERQISEVAMRATPQTRVIFVAGPSSSSKTTFANRLTCMLRGRSFEPVRVSLDDFYGLPENAPRLKGTDKPDFEHLHALDIARIQRTLAGLINGEEIIMASYDFKRGQPGDGKKLKLSPTGVLVVEGIHALNDEITKVVPQSMRLRVFIQPIGTLAWDELRTIEHQDSRLLRRMCRDFLFRGRSADSTLDSWPAVREGEDIWILPNQTKADVYFNSSIMYEQFVLRVFAVPLLRQVPHISPNYPQAKRLLRMLEPMLPIPVQYVPENSLLCEFLPGGSQYEDFFF
ncbi:Uridine kinase [Spironucleus salmonicida]|uniref:Uridine kinase n=1 Tax=Spironucleus salmonicida TaxID=348837 RepID=V6LWD7_9EUKA|nr:Uridine kinase [Spironucleus salmonicida]|eukprot:EST48942.1 Uridine kinase [Spironucleus salmonicida]